MPASPTRTEGGSELFYDPMDRTMSGNASTIGGELADCSPLLSTHMVLGVPHAPGKCQRACCGWASCTLTATACWRGLAEPNSASSCQHSRQQTPVAMPAPSTCQLQ